MSGCRSRPEVRRFVPISLSKPTKQKFPHGKLRIFECAMMCWKPSHWKIPDRLQGALTSLVKPLTQEHTSVLWWYLPPGVEGKAVGCSKLGTLLRAADRATLPLHHPGRSGGPECDARRTLVSYCASFAPLFVNVLKCICQGGFTPWCWAVQAAP